MKLVVFAVLVAVVFIVAGCTTQSAQVPSTQTQQESVHEDQHLESETSQSETNQGDDTDSDDDHHQAVDSQDLETHETKTTEEKTQESISLAIADGTYTEDVTYQYHSGSERITISITVENDIVTDASITPHNPNPSSKKYIEGVDAALPDLVIGKKIDEIELPKQISGSSLTTKALKNQLQHLVDTY